MRDHGLNAVGPLLALEGMRHRQRNGGRQGDEDQTIEAPRDARRACDFLSKNGGSGCVFVTNLLFSLFFWF